MNPTETKAGQPVKVTASQAHEVKPSPAKDPLLDDVSVKEGVQTEASLQEVETQQENLSDDDDDDLFNDDNAFSASGTSALQALEEDDTDEATILGAAGGVVPVEVDDQDDDESVPDEMGVATVFKHDCLRCTCLIPDLVSSKFIKARAFKDCHYENGNNECPAKAMMIVVGIPVTRIVKKYMAAHIEGNNEEIARINAKLATVDEGQRALANQSIKEALREHYRKAA